MLRVLARSLALAGFLAALAACSSSQIVDDLPATVGLPADAPARPATPYQHPAVHDMPPPRSSEPMSAEDQLKLEKELSTARDRQEGNRAADQKPALSPKKTVKKETKPKPAGEQNDTAAGAKSNP